VIVCCDRRGVTRGRGTGVVQIEKVYIAEMIPGVRDLFLCLAERLLGQGRGGRMSGVFVIGAWYELIRFVGQKLLVGRRCRRRYRLKVRTRHSTLDSPRWP
jgi:hypothetical protein